MLTMSRVGASTSILRRNWDMTNKSFIAGFLGFIFLACSLVDLPNRISVGPFSIQGVLTFFYASSVLLLIINRPISSISKIVVLMFTYFIIWCWISFAWSALNQEGIQNIVVYMTFFAIIALVSREHDQSHLFQQKVLKYLTVASYIAASMYVPTLLVAGLGNAVFISSRGFALYALVGLTVTLSRWRYDKNKIWMLLSMGMLLLIALSLSRTALVTGVVLTILSRYQFKGVWKKFKFFMFLFTLSSLLYYTVFNFEPIRSRFFEGDTSLVIGGIPINAMGRMELWNTVSDSFWKSPLLGNGAGSAEAVLAAQLGYESQPHNDYLRILHDYGFIGFALWCTVLLSLMFVSWRSWKRADIEGDPSASNHMAAFLVLMALVLASLTDNVIIYIFFMAPAAMLIGLSIGKKRRFSQSSLRSAVV